MTKEQFIEELKALTDFTPYTRNFCESPLVMCIRLKKPDSECEFCPITALYNYKIPSPATLAPRDFSFASRALGLSRKNAIEIVRQTDSIVKDKLTPFQKQLLEALNLNLNKE